MDQFELEKVALQTIYEYLLAMPNTDQVLHSMADVLLACGIDEHRALVVRQCLRVLYEDYVQSSQDEAVPFRVDSNLLKVIFRLVFFLQQLGLQDLATGAMQLVYGRLVSNRLFSLLSADTARFETQLERDQPWYERPYMQDAVAAVEALPDVAPVVDHWAIIQKRDQMIGAWDSWMGDLYPQEDCVDELNRVHSKEVIADSIGNVVNDVEASLRPPFLETLLLSNMDSYMAYKAQPLHTEPVNQGQLLLQGPDAANNPPQGRQEQQQQSRAQRQRKQQRPRRQQPEQQLAEDQGLGSGDEQQAHAQDEPQYPVHSAPPLFQHQLMSPRNQQRLQEKLECQRQEQKQQQQQEQEARDRWELLRPEERRVVEAQQQREQLAPQAHLQQQQAEEGVPGQGGPGGDHDEEPAPHPSTALRRNLPGTIARELVSPARLRSRERSPARRSRKVEWTLEMEKRYLDYVKVYGRRWGVVADAIDRTGPPFLKSLSKNQLNDKFKALRRSGRIELEDYPAKGHGSEIEEQY